MFQWIKTLHLATLFVLLGVCATAHSSELAISLDYRGDRLQRVSEEPTLSIYTDGSIHMPRIYAHSMRHFDQIEVAEVESVLDFLRKQGFFETPEAGAAPQLATSRSSHTSSTVIYARDGDRSRRAVMHGVQYAGGAQGLRSIKARLEQLMTIVKLGGKEKTTLWLDQANQELRLQKPDAPALVLEDLLSGAQRADGSSNVVFARAEDGIKVSISISAMGEYGVYVFAGESQ